MSEIDSKTMRRRVGLVGRATPPSPAQLGSHPTPSHLTLAPCRPQLLPPTSAWVLPPVPLPSQSPLFPVGAAQWLLLGARPVCTQAAGRRNPRGTGGAELLDSALPQARRAAALVLRQHIFPSLGHHSPPCTLNGSAHVPLRRTRTAEPVQALPATVLWVLGEVREPAGASASSLVTGARCEHSVPHTAPRAPSSCAVRCMTCQWR